MDDDKGDEDDGASLSGTPVFLILRFKSLGWKQVRSSNRGQSAVMTLSL